MRAFTNRFFSIAAIPLLALAFLSPSHHPQPSHHHRHHHCQRHGRRCRLTVVTFTSPGSGTWLAPAGVTSISVATWGAGGGGQRGSFSAGGNGGGGAESAFESLVQVTPGVLYAWTVGAAGLGATQSGQQSTAGGSSMFAADTLTVVAHGGDRGGGDGLGGTGSTNTTHFNGGNGGGGFASGLGGGGGGGSSAGTGGAGGNGGNSSGVPGGSGGTPPAGGAAGGAGGARAAGALTGSAPGAGGGGGGASGGNGGNGAPGQVQITYTAPQQPQIPFFPAGYAPTSQDFTNWVTNPLAFLTSKIAFRGVCGSAVVLAANTNMVLPMTVLEDPYAGWQSSGTQWLAPQNGLYSVTLVTSCAANSSQPVLAAKVGLNSMASTFTVAKAWVPPSSVPGIASGSVLTYLYGGQDSIQGIAEAIGAAGTVVTTTGQNPRLSIMWVSE